MGRIINFDDHAKIRDQAVREDWGYSELREIYREVGIPLTFVIDCARKGFKIKDTIESFELEEIDSE